MQPLANTIFISLSTDNYYSSAAATTQ